MSLSQAAIIHPVSLGFIDFTIDNRIARVPVQFFDTPLGKVALLLHYLPERDAPFLCMVVDELNPVEIGDLDRTLETYRDQYAGAHQHPLFIEKAGNLLELFRWLHTMAMKGMSPGPALEESARQREQLELVARRANNTWEAFQTAQADPALQRSRLVTTSCEEPVAFHILASPA